MFGFNKKYFLLTILLLAIEIVIGLYVRDSVIRPYGGDFLVVMLIYCFVKSFLSTPVVPTAISVLVFAYMVEISQYYKLVVHLGLKDSKLANILLGNSFSWTDMLCYTAGILVVIEVENIMMTRRARKHLPATTLQQ